MAAVFNQHPPRAEPAPDAKVSMVSRDSAGVRVVFQDQIIHIQWNALNRVDVSILAIAAISIVQKEGRTIRIPGDINLAIIVLGHGLSPGLQIFKGKRLLA